MAQDDAEFKRLQIELALEREKRVAQKEKEEREERRLEAERREERERKEERERREDKEKERREERRLEAERREDRERRDERERREDKASKFQPHPETSTSVNVQVGQQGPRTMLVQEEENYCGPITWVIAIFTGIWCMACCPVDKRMRQKIIPV